MIREIRPALVLLALLTVLLGFAYPSAVWIAGQMFWPHHAQGSLLYRNGRFVGSSLIAQPFVSDIYFHPRPSETITRPFNFAFSGASNLNLANPSLKKQLAERKTTLEKTFSGEPPVDLITASASGLDPHISPEAAFYQVKRVAKARGLSEQKLMEIIKARIEEKDFGFLGDRRINVLLLNLDLDSLARGGS